MKTVYKTQGTCSREIRLEVEDGKIKNVGFTGGCSGNLKAISKLVTGMSVNEVISLLEGLKCGQKSTSCGDQLAKALKSMEN